MLVIISQVKYSAVDAKSSGLNADVVDMYLESIN